MNPKGGCWWLLSVAAYTVSLVAFAFVVPDEPDPLRIVWAVFLAIMPPLLAVWLVVELGKRP